MIKRREGYNTPTCYFKFFVHLNGHEVASTDKEKSNNSFLRRPNDGSLMTPNNQVGFLI